MQKHIGVRNTKKHKKMKKKTALILNDGNEFLPIIHIF